MNSPCPSLIFFVLVSTKDIYFLQANLNWAKLVRSQMLLKMSFQTIPLAEHKHKQSHLDVKITFDTHTQNKGLIINIGNEPS